MSEGASSGSQARAVTLVIPGRNCAATIDACLAAALAIREDGTSPLAEIVFVDDGSTDETRERVGGYPVTCLPGSGRGPGAARNLGWRHATTPFVWFVDSDCVAEPGSLALLLPHLDDPGVAAVSGSYANANPGSLLSRLIHEEIITRHESMPAEVNFLATFNVLYRRSVLEQLDGFDERYLKAQDAELSFRVQEAGHRCRFELPSRVAHHHETSWWRYLRTQQAQGYWRVFLHLEHRGHGAGDSYSGLTDHLQPPLAMVVLAALPLLLLPAPWRALPAVPALVLLALQLPMTVAIVRRTRRSSDLAFASMSYVRAFFRGVGMSQGTLGFLLKRRS